MPLPHENKPQTVTYKDLTWQIDPTILDDLDFIEHLYDLTHADETTQDGDGALAVVPLLRTLCGDKYKEVKSALRDPESGRIDAQTVQEFTMDVMKQLNPNS
ncbi:hypothetical protein EJ419_07335 [Alloscardovia theropitheci]|uniref:Uncharacterized protein n=1 Tax=Alloscardovia theropitheci TaxID=2496842 RepID=A0A4R0QWS8_9BIFI|nr:hypothetical protein [Alloscardovia theropitheci]TCD53771.1 hypothetical protein EJ419_07335 [Alloscardovia theropitheci]